MSDALHHLLAAGQSPWYDNLSRAVIESGELASLIANGIRGVTSNPTIFEHAMKAGDAYDDALRTHAARGADPADVYWDLIVHDIQSACDLFTEVHADSDGVDGVVSVEVAPDLAADAAKTVAMARDLSGRIQRPNLMIKIPATKEGIPAIWETILSYIATTQANQYFFEKRAAQNQYWMLETINEYLKNHFYNHPVQYECVSNPPPNHRELVHHFP